MEHAVLEAMIGIRLIDRVALRIGLEDRQHVVEQLVQTEFDLASGSEAPGLLGQDLERYTDIPVGAAAIAGHGAGVAPQARQQLRDLLNERCHVPSPRSPDPTPRVRSCGAAHRWQITGFCRGLKFLPSRARVPE